MLAVVACADIRQKQFLLAKTMHLKPLLHGQTTVLPVIL